MHGAVGFQGDLQVRRIGRERPPFLWRLRNTLRTSFLLGWLFSLFAKWFSRAAGIVTFTSELALIVYHNDGSWTDYGVVCHRLVTDAFAAYLVDDLDNASGGADVSLFNYHGIGTGSTAESAGDTALVAELTTELNPDNTRATGTRSQPAANQYRSVGTLTVDSAVNLREHGFFNNATVGSGTLLDRSVYASINLASGESIQCTYTLTVNSGG